MARTLASGWQSPKPGSGLLASALAGALILALMTPARAQSKSEIAAARKAYKKGEAAFQAGRYEEALNEFKKGYDLSKKELFLLNIGYAHEQLGNYTEALDYYERYRATNPPAEELPDLDVRIAECRAHLPPPVPVPAPVPEPGPLPLPAAKPALVLNTKAPENTDDRPIYKEWYLWAGVGAAVVLAVVIGVGISSSGPAYQSRGTWGVLPSSAWGGGP